MVALAACDGSHGGTGTSRYIPFDVVFDTHEPLGLRLDASLNVLGFSRKPDGSLAHAEASNLIRVSDTLVKVNGKDVKGLDLQRAVMEIRDAELPKVRLVTHGRRPFLNVDLKTPHTPPPPPQTHPPCFALPRRFGAPCLRQALINVMSTCTGWQVLTFLPSHPGEDRAHDVEELSADLEVARPAVTPRAAPTCRHLPSCMWLLGTEYIVDVGNV